MKQHYTLFLLLLIFCTGCSKDFLKRYEDRLEGEWRLSDIDRRGIGNSSSFPIRVGDRFQFLEDGSLLFTRATGQQLEGNWDVRRIWTNGNCYTDDFGNYDCNTRRVKTLQLAAADFATQEIISVHFDEIQFTGTNRFKGFIYDGWKTYVFRFRR